MRIVFMGTPDFAVPTLQALIDDGHMLAGVFTQPDKPVGRKQILTPPPVKVLAEKNGIPVFQPATLRDGTALEILTGINPEIIVVVAYGKILPVEILELPKFGCVNGHASLLPRHRGASPIQWAIACGDTVTGITTMFMDKGMDTGDMLETVQTPIADGETAQQLHDRLSLLGAELMCSTLRALEAGMVKPVKQDDSLATYAPVISKEMAHLDFTKTAPELERLIRAFSGWPVAYFFLDGRRVKVYSAAVTAGNGTAGSIITAVDELIVSCGGNTALSIEILQPEGSKRMTAKEMLRGHKIEAGTVLQ